MKPEQSLIWVEYDWYCCWCCRTNISRIGQIEQSKSWYNKNFCVTSHRTEYWFDYTITVKLGISKLFVHIHHGMKLVKVLEKATLMENFYKHPDYYFPIPRIHVGSRNCRYLRFSSSSIEDKYIIDLMVCISYMLEYLKMLKCDINVFVILINSCRS